jgi:hypothetical protein
MREMHRVLRPGGRAVVLVWRDLNHSPGYVVLANALEIHAGPEAATIMRAPFVFGDDPTPLASLHKDAGFVDVTVQGEPCPGSPDSWRVRGAHLGSAMGCGPPWWNLLARAEERFGVNAVTKS